jgi:ParB-like chromosome segregation protein Spo0J
MPANFPTYKVRPTADLTPYATNARTHSAAQVAQIAASITRFGFTNPVLIGDDGGVIAGHGRLLAAAALGITEVPTIELVGLSATERAALILADNKLALNAGWDLDLLAGELRDLDLAAFDLTLTGFTEEEIAGLIGDTAAVIDAPALPDGDRAPFQCMSFTLHDDQVDAVKAAMDRAKALGHFDGPNDNDNGNALARIAEAYRG